MSLFNLTQEQIQYLLQQMPMGALASGLFAPEKQNPMAGIINGKMVKPAPDALQIRTPMLVTGKRG